MAATENANLGRITVVPGQRSGQPCIRDLRITVWDVLDMLASGMTEEDSLAELFPGSTRGVPHKVVHLENCSKYIEFENRLILNAH